MPRTVDSLHVFNRGRISRLALARTDLDRTRLSADVMTNWIPRSLGSMSIRPGLEYIGTLNNSSTAIIVPFVFSSTFTALLEMTNQTMQVWIDDVKLSRDPSTAAITNGDFSSSDLTGWTDADESGSTSYWYQDGYSFEDGGIDVDSTVQLVTALTVIDRSWTLDANRKVSHLGMQSNSSGIYGLRIARRDSSGVYTIVHATDITHTGSSWEYTALSSTFTTNSSDTFYVAIGYSSGSSASESIGGSTQLRATIAADIATSSSSFSEDTNKLSVGRVRYVGTTDSTAALGLVGNNYTRAKRYQTVTASSGNHGIAIHVAEGRVTVRIGSSTGGDDYFNEKTFRPGYYSLGITSTGNFNIELSAATDYTSRVGSVSIESSGSVSITTPWVSSDLDLLRWDQSGDIIFSALPGYKSQRLERYSSDSWAVAEFDPQTGPFRNPEPSLTRLNVTGLSGDLQMEADRAFFRSNHVGALFRLTAPGQSVETDVSGADQYTNPIRVSGVGSDRLFRIAIESTGYAATLRLQRSVGSSASFSDVPSVFFSSTISNLSTDYDDRADNQIIYYRIGVASADYSSGAPTVSLQYDAGGITGIGKVTNVFASSAAEIVALTPFGSTAITELWQEGAWSGFRGWPSAVTFHEGRIWFAGKANIWGSVSDEFENFDLNFFGDAGPISRSIAAGGVDSVDWLVSLGRLIVGTPVRELNAKTNSLEDPLTPSNFNLRDISSQGSRKVNPLRLDRAVYFVQRAGTRLMETSLGDGGFEYQTLDRSVLIPEIGEPSFTRLAAQRKPDTRIHAVRSDGTVGMFVHEPAENVLAWCDVESSGGVNGVIEDVAVLPSSAEDAVYYIVRREINGSTVRYLEKWALESQNKGGSSNRIADSFYVQESTATTTVTGLDHLVGAQVVAWGATSDLGSYVVSSTGEITLSQNSTTTVVGLPFNAVYTSAKLDYAFERAGIGTGLTQKKRLSHVGLLLVDTHARGIEFGPSTNVLQPMPVIESGVAVSSDKIHATYDEAAIPFPGKWDTDSRLVLVGSAPKPATVIGAVIVLDTNPKI